MLSMKNDLMTGHKCGRYFVLAYFREALLGGGGGGGLLGIRGGGVLPGSPNPDPISDQNMPFSIPISDLT